MEHRSSQEITVELLREAVESEGCYLAEVNLESLAIKINGPNELVGACARAVAEVLD